MPAKKKNKSKVVPRTNKYLKRLNKTTDIDVYDVLEAFNVTCPAMAHAIKKCLMPGDRGHKSKQEDKYEIIDSVYRSIELDVKREELIND